MAEVTLIEYTNDFICSRKGSSLLDAFNRQGLLSTNNNFTTSYMPVGAQGKTKAGGTYWKALSFGARFILAGAIPLDAIITDVTIRYYVRADRSDRNFNVEFWDFNWGTSLTTTDHQNVAELQSLFSNNKRIGSDSTSGMSTGWNDLVMDTANAVAWVQSAVDTDEDYVEYYVATNDNRIPDTGTTTTQESLIEIDDSAFDTEFTIQYVVPDNQTIFLGTHF